ncbi:serine/threonine protein kinase [Aequitasia blattaphilus]|uniref:non-specific serine/threonine protein kinase n=1 Tax=Aequitasia blattaphilus TaxID=2949332 RepID=A0ABT1E6M4_9FIRM|nr:serine/threonine-protein kinase [Aequitasia blattaphilus]MCP1101244.1 serine/threonine protein kinase [Aequitasia blattaphilus]MCR8613884.1 serine/threonine protein kinase [Aequitasia blattaphilus]
MTNEYNDIESSYGKKEKWQVIGRGGSGVVYKVYHRRLQKYVVIKSVERRGYSDERLRREVDILKNLNHEYLPQVMDFFSEENYVYIVMSYIEGKSFDELISEGRRYGKQQILAWTLQLCEAIRYLHSQRPPIIHGDIKPANIMLTPQGKICLIDFNIAFYMNDSKVWGYTRGYTSPEQYSMVVSGALPDEEIDERSDLYSLGACMYYIATGQKIATFNGGINYALLANWTDESFATLIDKVTKCDSNERFQNAYEMEQALLQLGKDNYLYRRLIKRQTLETIGIISLFFASLFLVVLGIWEYQEFRGNNYNTYIEAQMEAIEEEDFEAEEEYYNKAKNIDQHEVEVYYQHAFGLSKKKEYQKCIAYIDNEIFEDEKIEIDEQRMDDIYYLKADALYNLEKYSEAVSAYEKVIDFNKSEPIYFRDYAIALAKDGDTSYAKVILDEAQELGLEADSISYVKGEIQLEMSNKKAALVEFRECEKLTEDMDMKMRSILKQSQILNSQKAKVEAREVLLRGIEEIPEEKQFYLLNSLVAIDISMGDESEEYLDDGIECINKIVEKNWESYNTYDSLAVIYLKKEELTQSEDVLNKMLDEYGEDYNIYKRFAFVEMQKQETISENSRSYYEFREYFNQSMELYSDEGLPTDAEMDLLRQTYAQLENKGWFDD